MHPLEKNDGMQTRSRVRIVTTRRRTRIVVGGYDPSLAPEAYESCPDVDFIVRGEGEQTLCELLRAIESEARLEPRVAGRESSRLGGIPGLSYRTPGGFVHNAPRSVMRLASNPLRLPDRGARVLGGYTLLGRAVDVVETSRGCTFDCSFCSIIEMRGRNFHPYPIDRVLADIADARAHGAGRSSWSTTTSRSTSSGSKRSAGPSSTPASTTRITSCRR